ncbi:50S ribosomal protein L11 methyltransferase [Melioribacteraceae bacterium 4301-Me]|uniref:50S ribosomal protein L11 methyltransferase n=1 Tax=Pyranulibacter aquaticus TaxID=3163344 RepID=UPI00359BCD7F
MKKFKQFNIVFEPFVPDLVSGELWELNITGIDERESELVVYSDESSMLTKEMFERILNKIISENLIISFNVTETEIENKNWNEEWEKKIQVIEVTDKIVIKPSFKEYNAKKGQIIITIDPKMSFGTGEHQTTQLMLQLIEKYIVKGDKVLDVGTGTGILAIASIKLGAARALAIDNDEWCFNNANENVKINLVEDKIRIQLAEIHEIQEKNFDLILANINKNVLLSIADDVYSKIKKTGRLILSGLLLNDEKEVINKYTSVGFQLAEKKYKDEWLAIVFTSA